MSLLITIAILAVTVCAVGGTFLPGGESVTGPRGTSMIGPTGPDGSSTLGDTGPTGILFLVTGPTGNNGITGPPGITGPTGATGPFPYSRSAGIVDMVVGGSVYATGTFYYISQNSQSFLSFNAQVSIAPTLTPPSGIVDFFLNLPPPDRSPWPITFNMTNIATTSTAGNSFVAEFVHTGIPLLRVYLVDHTGNVLIPLTFNQLLVGGVLTTNKVFDFQGFYYTA